MNQAIKAKWVAALRSGEYKQCTEKLHVGEGFCCYGVLCELSGLHQWEPTLGASLRYGDRDGMPPDSVNQWAGFQRGKFGGFAHPSVRINGRERKLDDHNDNGATFAEIADAIEAQL